MIVCPNCNHQNPDGAVQCEACYTPLPTLAECPSCGASVQSDASFCGQCGFDLRSVNQADPSQVSSEPTAEASRARASSAQPDLAEPDFEATVPGDDDTAEDVPDLLPPDPLVTPDPISGIDESDWQASPPSPVASVNAQTSAAIAQSEPASTPPVTATQIQTNQAKLFHVQTNTAIELPPHLSIIHLGKPNDRVPPTVDVSGFPNSEIVSRIHANIRVEGDIYYIEDVGSSNGTYINNMPLPPGNRHRLRPGDRVALGKGDKVTFIFQSV